MPIPQGYNPVKIGNPDCPQEWLDYFLDWTNDEEDKPIQPKPKFPRQSRQLSNLFNVTEDQVDNPNYWINL
ncbi:MAG: hypothetical protein F6K58_08520 [Symploca sp. SIO2E9]|nr:hypothetical protein [Symploca sp. SIO2E9]